MKKNLKKGFTLTELVVVIVIIGILASVLIPTLTSYITRSRKSAAEQEATARLQEAAAYVLDHDNEEWFAWNEYMKSHKVQVKTSNDYYVLFENGKLDQSKTDKNTISGAQATLVFNDADPDTYVLTVTGGDADLSKVFSDFPAAANGTITITLNSPVTVAGASAGA